MNDQGRATLQDSLNAVTGLWPFVHMHSFEALSGTKTDEWLVRTVSDLLITIGNGTSHSSPL